MSLLPKRRSRSETRDSALNYDNNPVNNQHNLKSLWGKVRQNSQFPHLDKANAATTMMMGGGGGMGKRRTSAEMISEAKTFLSDVVGGGGGSSTNTINNPNSHQQYQPTTSGKYVMTKWKNEKIYCLAFVNFERKNINNEFTYIFQWSVGSEWLVHDVR